MNWKKEFKKYFEFLEREGYKLKYFEKNSGNEAYYKKGSLIIEFYFDTCDETIDVILNENGNRVNLLVCSYFEKNKRDELFKQITGVKNLHQLFKDYSDFLISNIKK